MRSRTWVLDYLNQDEVWRPNGASKDLRLADMTPRHRGNLLAWLRRKAFNLKEVYTFRLIAGPQPSGDMACDAFDSMVDELEQTTPEVWIEDWPLVKKLVELAERDRQIELRLTAARARVPAGATAALERRHGSAGQ